jgi:hypothetical protein
LEHHSNPAGSTILRFVLDVHDLGGMTADGQTLAKLTFGSLRKTVLDTTPAGVDTASVNVGEHKDLVKVLIDTLIGHGVQQKPVLAARCAHHNVCTKRGDEDMSGIYTASTPQAGGSKSRAFRAWGTGPYHPHALPH